MALRIRIADRTRMPSATMLIVCLCLEFVVLLSNTACAEKTAGNVAPTLSSEKERGLTIETAIPLVGYKNTLDGIAAEHEYLDRTYPGWDLIDQAVFGKDNRFYDLMNIKLPGGETRGIYFDITSWYGSPLVSP